MVQMFSIGGDVEDQPNLITCGRDLQWNFGSLTEIVASHGFRAE